MPIIQGTDGDDVLYGDGKSQINGGKGNDTIYPYGGVHEEVILEPGNETYDVRNGNGPQILVPSNDPAAGRDTYINLTNQIWSINGRTVPSLTIFDPYGGVDRLIDSKNDSIGINVIHGSDRNEYLKGGGTFNVYPNFGTDYVDSANDIRFQDWGKVNITIKGTTGEVVIDSSKLTYKNIKNWSFSNGEFNINGSREGETFNFWGSDKQITVAGGGGGDTFQVMNSGSNKVIILDFDSDDTIRLWNWFLTGNDLIINQQLRGYSDAELKALIEITPNQIAGTTTLTLKTLKPSQNPAIYTLNGNYELTSVSRTSNNDVDIRLNPIPIYGDGKSAIIKGTDGNDIIYGDGVGQIKAGSGDDLIFPSGKPHQEVWLDPGNDTIDLKNSINSAAQIYSPSDDLSLGNTYVNLTKNDWSIDNKIIRSRTILDPYGGEDKVINSIYPDRIMLSLWGTIRNEFLKSDDYATLNILGPKFNQDTKLGPGDVHFFNWKAENNIIIPGSAGVIRIGDSTLTYDTNTFWIFENGSFNIQGSKANERLQFNEDKESAISIAGGGGSDTFVTNGVRNVTILDYSIDDKIELNNLFLVRNDQLLTNKLRNFSLEELRNLISLTTDQSKGITVARLKSLAGDSNDATYTLLGIFDLNSVLLDGVNVNVTLKPMAINGDGKSPIKGTPADDLIQPFGNLIGEIALSPGNDLFKFQRNDKVYYFANSPSYQSDGFLLNLGSNALTKNGLAILSGQLYDGYSGVDTLDFSNLASGFGIQLNIESSPANDQIEISRGLFNSKVDSVLLNLKPGFGSDSFYSDGSIRSILAISGNASVSNINIFPSSSNFGGFHVNKDYLDLRNINEWFLLDASASYNFTGDLNRQILILGSPRTKVAAGPGPDDFIISSSGVRAEITDYSVDDRLVANWGFWTNYSAQAFSSMLDSDFRSKILLQFNISTYETTVRLESLSGLTASYVLSGFFDKYDIVKSGLELEVRLTDSRVISRYTGDVLTSSAGKVGPWLVHDMTKAVTLTPYQDLVSFDASQGKTASLLSGFKSGSDLLQLAASTAPAGAAISANLENRNFLSGAGIKLPASPEQYVIYDTSTGVVYFDQDGNGPSPTWPALILEKGTALVASDIQISKPQVYTLAGDRGVINEGETLSVLVGSSNVAVGTEVSYSITGISPFDVSGVKLTGSVKLDANGEALIKIPLAADSISEGPETIVLTLAGQILSVPINDTSRAAADTQSATYIVRANTASVDEGGVAGFSLTTTNVAAGTAVSYILSGVSAADVVGGQLAGVVVVDAQGKATITVPLANDNLTEGVETLVVTVQGFGATMQINDNSKALLTLPASYAITTPGAGVFEVRAAVGSEVNTASSLVVKVGNTWTTGFRANAEALLKWHQNPASVARNTALDGLSTDQALAALERGLTGSEQSAFITLLGLIADVEMRNGMPTFDGNLVLPAVATPSYQLQALSASVNEGTNAQFQVTTTNVAAGTELGYTLSGQGITSADIIGGQLSGKVIIGSNGQGTISVGLASDQSTEGSETLVVTLEGKQSTISIQDTSIAVALDQVAPVLSGPYPPTTNAPVDKPLVFYFSEPIKAANVSLIKLLGPGNVATSIQLSVSANMLQITPAGMINNTNYGVSIPQGALADLAGNAFAGLTRYDITTVGIQEESGGGGGGGGGGG